LHEPFIHQLVPVLVNQMGDVFPEIKSQQELIRKVITEEELAFLRTLAQGIKKFEKYIQGKSQTEIDGDFAFELFDTYGFPVDLTQLMAKEIGWNVNMDGFEKQLQKQKNRSREAAVVDTSDWTVLDDGNDETVFVGYEATVAEVKLVKYRAVESKKKKYFQLVFDKTPFYAEAGGQVGDRGVISANGEIITIEDTQRENDLIIHIAKKLPGDLNAVFEAKVIETKRNDTARNHSATHLMHAALKSVLGTHVEQKGSLVDSDHLRFDFAHFSKMSDEEISAVEKMVNEKIRENIQIREYRDTPMDEALKMGATALFGEKYGEKVRVIAFDPSFSVELCGGIHVPATGSIGFFKILSESAIAAGIRRIEAVTGMKAEEYINSGLLKIREVGGLLKNQKDIVKGVQNLIESNSSLQKQISRLNHEISQRIKSELKQSAEEINGLNFISAKVNLDTAGMKDLAFALNREVERLFLVLGTDNGGKAGLIVMIGESLIKEKDFDAGKIIREIARNISGGGGGQPHFATAGGKNTDGIEKALHQAREIVSMNK